LVSTLQKMVGFISVRT